MHEPSQKENIRLPPDQFNITGYFPKCAADQVIDFSQCQECSFEDIHSKVKYPSFDEYGLSFTIRVKK